MAPKKDDKKKDPKGKGAEAEPEGKFEAREPDEPVEVEVEPTPVQDPAEWEMPLPVWNDEEVAQEPWNPAATEPEQLFVDGDFDRAALPPDIAELCVGWKRAPGSSKSATMFPADEEPVAQFEPGPGIEAFEELPAINKCVVTEEEFRTGTSELQFEDWKPPFVQFMLAQFALIMDQPRLFEEVLWKRIHPQNKDGMPLYNPNGKYIVQLLVFGYWRKVEVDDLVPVMTTGGALHPHAALFPAKQGSGGPGPIWPLLLTKALLKAFHGYCTRGLFSQIPVLTALTGYIPQRQLLSMANILEQEEQPLVTIDLPTAIEEPDPEAKVPPVPIKSEKKKKAVVATVPFLVAEVEQEPPQLRLKALVAHPVGFLEDKASLVVPETPAGVREGSEEGSEEGSASSYESDGASEAEEGQAEGAEGTEAGDAEEEEGDDKTAPAEEEKPAAEGEEVELVEGGRWVLWDDPGFVAARGADLRVYYDAGQFQATQHDTTMDTEEKPRPKGPLLLQVYLPQPPAPEPPAEEGEAPAEEGEEAAEEGEGSDGARGTYESGFESAPAEAEPEAPAEPEEPLSGVGFWYESRLGPDTDTASMQITYCGPWFSEVGPGTIPTVDTSGAPMVQLHGAPGSFVRVFHFPPGTHTFLLEEDAVAGGVLSVYVEKPPEPPAPPPVDTEDPAAAAPEDPPEVDRPKVTVMEPVEALQERLLSLEKEHPAVDGYHVYAKGVLKFDGRGGAATVDFWGLCSDEQTAKILRLTVFPIGEFALDLPAPEPVEGEEAEKPEPPFERAWGSRAPPIHSPEAWTLAPMTRPQRLTLPWMRRAQIRVPPSEAAEGQVLVLLEGLGRVPAGSINLNMLVRPVPVEEEPVMGEDGEPVEPEPVAPSTLELEELTRTCWSGVAAPSDHNLVLRERLTTAEGPVRATVRISVSDPELRLRFSVQVQHAPFPAVNAEGEVGEQHKATNIPAYGRRQGWIDALETLRVLEGQGSLAIDHICFSPEVIYILHVESETRVDDPASLAWKIEVFSDQPLVLGKDPAAEELEDMVRAAWEEKDEGRAARAAALRQEFLDAQAAGRGVVRSGLRPPDAPPEGEEENEDEEAKATRLAKLAELEALEAVAANANPPNHAREDVRAFLDATVTTPAHLEMFDPYQVIPLTEETREIRKEDRQYVIDAAVAAKASMEEKAAEALERFKENLENMSEWRSNAQVTMSFEALRSDVKQLLELRHANYVELVKELAAGEPKRLDELLDDAGKYDTWRQDSDLITLAQCKQQCNDAHVRLQRLVDSNTPQDGELAEGEEAPPPSLEDQKDMATLINTVEECRAQLALGCQTTKSVAGFPIPEDCDAYIARARAMLEAA